MVSELNKLETNKEQIELLEVGLGSVQFELQQLRVGLNENFNQFEETINQLSKVLLEIKESLSYPTPIDGGNHYSLRTQDGSKPIFSSKLAKLEFPKFLGDYQTEWFTRVDQFFEYQSTLELQKVSLASFHLEG